MTAGRSCGMLRPMRARSAWLSLVPLFVVLGCGGDDNGGGATPAGPGVPLKVMSRNLYLGADLLPVVASTTVEDIPVQVAALWKTMEASNLPERAKLLADEIAAAKPDLIGLQEAVIFYKQVPSDFSFAAPQVNATEVAYDFVQLLLTELATRGVEYVTAATSVNTDVELPAADKDTTPFDVRLTDRDVILARKGLQVLSQQTGTFQSHLKFTIPFGVPMGAPVDLVRGYARVEAELNGARFTFANTHLEVGGGGGNDQAKALLGPLQEGQAHDLLTLLMPVTGPLILVGDFNSAADGSTTMSYGIIAARFNDAYARVNPGMPGFTCCSAIDGAQSMANQRIDIVFYRGGVDAKTVEIVGTDPAKRSMSGLWPSDHAGVVANVEVPGGTGSSPSTQNGKKY
jgi:endonuclease/exonuclease/phosphatase family metal-dependent hydrolase